MPRPFIPIQFCSAGYLPDFLSKCARKITIFECGAYYALTGRGGDVMILFLENRILWRVDKLAAAACSSL